MDLSKEQILCKELTQVPVITLEPVVRLQQTGFDVFHSKTEQSIKELSQIINNPEEYLSRLYRIFECLTSPVEQNGEIESNGFIFDLIDCYLHRYGLNNSFTSVLHIPAQALVIQRNSQLLSSGIKVKPFDSIGQDQRLWAQRKRKAQQNNG